MESASSAFDDDFITLGELTEYENAVWRFPNTTRCPFRSCNQYCGTRKKAINHYRDNHAKHAVLCKICNVPIMLYAATHHFDGHYVRKHPNVPPPAKVKTARHECSVCHASLKTYVYLRLHMQNVHGKKGKRNKKKRVTPKRRQVMASPTEAHHSSAASNVSENGDTHSDANSFVDISTDDDIGSETADGSVKTNTTAAMQLKSILKKKKKTKNRSFNVLNGPRPCTICGRSLKNYVLACSHYRQAHGRTVSMCPFCKTYFARSTALIQHMKVYHQFAGTDSLIASESPKTSIRSKSIAKKATKRTKNRTTQLQENRNEETVSDMVLNGSNDESSEISAPISILLTTNVTTSNENINESTEIPENDLITLGEMTEYQTMQWKFPQITHCPRLNCKQTFTSRNEAIRHYRTMHSIYDVLCQECEQIISLTGTHNLMNHYKRKHPDIQPPAKMFENKTPCTICHKVLSFAQLRIHMEKKHKPNQENDSQEDAKSTKKNARALKRKSSLQAEAVPESTVNNRMKIVLKRCASTPDVSGQCHPVVCHKSDEPTINDTPLKKNPSNASSDIRLSENEEQPKNVDEKQDDIPHNPQAENTAAEGSSKPEAKQKTRSTGVRNKACTICGMILATYASACDHYNRIHGRNVLMCPYCGQYFLQSNVLTKHVLVMHSKDTDCAGSCKSKKQVQKTASNIDESVVCPGAVNSQLMESVLTSMESSSSFEASTPIMESTSMEPCNAPEETTLPDDEPLNLCLKKADDDQHFSDSGTIDLLTGALDLSIRK